MQLPGGSMSAGVGVGGSAEDLDEIGEFGGDVVG
jgi:hypothetical protein